MTATRARTSYFDFFVVGLFGACVSAVAVKVFTCAAVGFTWPESTLLANVDTLLDVVSAFLLMV